MVGRARSSPLEVGMVFVYANIFFLSVGQLQPGLNGRFPRGERDHLACLRGRNGSGIYVMKVMYPPVGQRGASAVFKRVIPMPGQAG